MKAFKYLSVTFALFALFTSCNGEKKKLFMPDSTRWTDQDVPLNELDTGNVNTDSVAIMDQIKKMFLPSDSLIEGRPVSFYLNRRDVLPAAKNFYLLRLIPTIVNPEVDAICDSLTTTNDTTRPFYYFLFLRLNRLGGDFDDPEELPSYGVHYFFQFVDEFYKKLQMPQYKWSYSRWVYLISLNKISVDDIKTYIINTQTKNAKHLTTSLRKQIESFADSVVTHNGN
jgi:hypothetical protein